MLQFWNSKNWNVERLKLKSWKVEQFKCWKAAELRNWNVKKLKTWKGGMFKVWRVEKQKKQVDKGVGHPILIQKVGTFQTSRQTCHGLHICLGGYLLFCDTVGNIQTERQTYAQTDEPCLTNKPERGIVIYGIVLYRHVLYCVVVWCLVM